MLGTILVLPQATLALLTLSQQVVSTLPTVGRSRQQWLQQQCSNNMEGGSLPQVKERLRALDQT